MGKSKDDYKRKRSSPSSPPSGDEARIKRRKSREDEKKHKSKKKHKSHKTSTRHSDKGKKSDGKHKDKVHKRDNSSKLKVQELSKDDYFSKSNEFAAWLKEERNVFFSDLSSDSARSLFSEFVSEWNNQELESKYYEGITTGPRKLKVLYFLLRSSYNLLRARAIRPDLMDAYMNVGRGKRWVCDQCMRAEAESSMLVLLFCRRAASIAP
ncbi:Style cell-cycle inhibitor 1-B [Sesamum angolense]|uniref:Style cell-cycle inhibitor 1-B n=1 Tax=Sesamum angolense TaxID=2727404 RepID=A0AAE1WSJ9_9LAMI|nr:Style cell-cycle inhibitor 1-B [Sesamum angolense]